MSVDSDLRAIARRSAAQYSDSLLAAQGWTRAELVDAIHQRLRNKYSELRGQGRIVNDGGTIRLLGEGDCPTPEKEVFPSRAVAVKAHRRSRWGRVRGKVQLHPYLCPAGDHWHLTHHSPAAQRRMWGTDA